jgi:hypothetical protein
MALTCRVPSCEAPRPSYRPFCVAHFDQLPAQLSAAVIAHAPARGDLPSAKYLHSLYNAIALLLELQGEDASAPRRASHYWGGRLAA